MNMGYGLTSGFWDIPFKTRFPDTVRQRLYGRKGYADEAQTKQPIRSA